MSFLNNTGVTTLWSRMINYLTGSHVKTSVVSGATDVDGALTKLQTKAGTATLTTTAKNLSGAVNELNSGATALKSTDSALESGLAIVATGNTHQAIEAGQYVYVKGHSSLAEGMYTATATIQTNGALSTSNLTALNAGGLNALNSRIANAYYKTEVLSSTNNSYANSGISYDQLKEYKFVTACLVINNNDNRNITSVTYPVDYVLTGALCEAPFTTDSELMCGIYYNTTTNQLMYTTGTGNWKCRILLSR